MSIKMSVRITVGHQQNVDYEVSVHINMSFRNYLHPFIVKDALMQL